MTEVCYDGGFLFPILFFIYVNLNVMIYIEESVTATRHIWICLRKNVPFEIVN